MCYNVKRMCIKSSSIRRGAGGEAPSLPLGEAGWGFNYAPQKNSTMICAVKIRKNILKGYTVE